MFIQCYICKTVGIKISFHTIRPSVRNTSITIIVGRPNDRGLHHDRLNTNVRNQKCGTPVYPPKNASAYIVGGEAARDNSWPWQVVLTLTNV